MDKRIMILIAIIAMLSVGIAYELYIQKNVKTKTVEINETEVNDTVVNATMVEESEETSTDSGQYGYCAICGNALTYEESVDEYTQGKVCHSCAANPYYQSGEGADYANQKLAEAYPDEY